MADMPISASADPSIAIVPGRTGGRTPGRPRDGALTMRRREEIIEAASRVFAQYGYRTTDLNQVAEILGVAKGTIYNYFPSKVELFMACVELGKNGFYQAHQKAIAEAGEAGPLVQIRQAMCAYFQFFDENPQHIELMMQARSEFKDSNFADPATNLASNLANTLPAAADPDQCPPFAPLIELLEQGVADGLIKPLSIKGMHDALLNLVVGAIFSKHYGKTTQSLSAQTADILEIVFNGILQKDSVRHGS
ncbi:MAG: TetR/AcrR family transcriptional regulator [Cyanobacteria bacterium REEB67]|nr:TetR/AcrR family transcriptional regulator [Cyanobacteria bacterium REEB67]